jgi:GNAT superfamily N-acetyltransferase
MNDRTSKFAFVAACVVAPLAVIGSAFSLYRIAVEAELALPLALPVALDLTALVAAAQIRARRHLVLGWATLLGGVVLSAGLQVADVWADGPIAWLVHGSLPLGALVCFELAMPGETKTAAALEAASAAAKPRPKPAPKPAAPAEAERPASLRPAEPDAAPLRPKTLAGLMDLSPVAEVSARNLERKGKDLSRRSLQAEMRAAGHPLDDVLADYFVRVFESAQRVTDDVVAEAVASGRGRLRPELLALAVDVAAELGKAPAELSRRELQDGIKAHPSRQGRGIGTKVAGEILDQLRRPTVGLEVVR